MSSFRVLIALLVAALLVATVAVGSIVGETTRVSIASDGAQGDGSSWRATVSDDGRYVAFSSGARNFCGTFFGFNQVFLHDRTEGTTSFVSVTSQGAVANWSSGNCPPSISADGRYVAFDSDAPNLAGLTVPEHRQVFVNDLVGLETSCASLSSTGELGNGNSENAVICTSGRYVAFESAATNFIWGDSGTDLDVYVRDRTAQSTTLVSASAGNAEVSGGGASDHPALSDDGRYVAFEATSGALVSGDSNACDDIFVRDLTAKSTSRVSVASDGSQGNSFSTDPSISADGRYVAFCSNASNLVGGDANGLQDIFIRDRTGGQTTRVSLTSAGVQANGWCRSPHLSSSGRYVIFDSAATNLVPGDTNGQVDVFRHDTQTHLTTRVSVGTYGEQGNYGSGGEDISADGRFALFYSLANNLVPGDTNSADDLFIRDTTIVLPDPAPTVTAFGPQGTAVGPTANINITFSTDMARPAAQGAMLINGVKAATFGGAFTWTARKMTFNPTNNLQPGTAYKVVIGKAARSRAGVTMAKGFTWTFTTKAARAPSVTVAAAPTALGAQITLNLASAADVTVSIRNLAGREVALLTPGRMAAGMHALVWNGKSRSGTKAPAGRYLVRVQAKSADGANCSALAVVQR